MRFLPVLYLTVHRVPGHASQRSRLRLCRSNRWLPLQEKVLFHLALFQPAMVLFVLLWVKVPTSSQSLHRPVPILRGTEIFESLCLRTMPARLPNPRSRLLFLLASLPTWRQVVLKSGSGYHRRKRRSISIPVVEVGDDFISKYMRSIFF